MRYYFLPAVILMLACSAACAEHIVIWQPDPTLHLSGVLLYDQVTVVDARIDKTSIGWLKTGALNRYADLNMDDSLSKSLAAYATGIIRSAETIPGELLVVVHDFRIEDRKGLEEIGTVHLWADLFRSNGGRYVHFRSMDTLYETKSGWDVTKGVQELASQAIFNMLAVTRNMDTIPRDIVQYTREEASAREETIKSTLALYTTNTPGRGIYHTYDDFLHLRTTDTDFIDQRISSIDQPTLVHFYRKNERGKKGSKIQPEECFAIYDGKDWRIARRGGFSILKKEGDDFYTTLYLQGLTDNSLVMGMMFGAIGSAIAAGDKSKHNTPYRTRLVPETGAFVPVKRVR